MLSRLYIFKGQYHNLDLPQFYPQFGYDANKYLGYDAITPDTKIIFHSDTEIPPEFKHLPVELNPEIGVPDNYLETVRGMGKKHIKFNAIVESWNKKYKRYKPIQKLL